MFIESKYINLLSFKLDQFTVLKEGLYNFRCPICGDSKKDKLKARGYIHKGKGFSSNEYFFTCHNGCPAMTFRSFLKNIDKDLYNQYLFEKLGPRVRQVPQEEFTMSRPSFKHRQQFANQDNVSTLQKKCNAHINKLTKISDLPDSNRYKKYLANRKIPNKFMYDIFLCTEFKAWVNKIIPGKFDMEKYSNDEERIIFPLRTVEGNVFAFQGRSLAATEERFKYFTIVVDDEVEPRVFGLDRINLDKRVFVTEGPIDSFFLENSLAICGSDIKAMFNYDHNFTETIYLLDCEPRNAQIVSKYQSAIDLGKNVVLLDPGKYSGKDVNDLILDGMSSDEIRDLLLNNTHSGLKAKMQFAKWKKV